MSLVVDAHEQVAVVASIAITLMPIRVPTSSSSSPLRPFTILAMAWRSR